MVLSLLKLCVSGTSREYFRSTGKLPVCLSDDQLNSSKHSAIPTNVNNLNCDKRVSVVDYVNFRIENGPCITVSILTMGIVRVGIVCVIILACCRNLVFYFY